MTSAHWRPTAESARSFACPRHLDSLVTCRTRQTSHRRPITVSSCHRVPNVVSLNPSHLQSLHANMPGHPNVCRRDVAQYGNHTVAGMASWRRIYGTQAFPKCACAREHQRDAAAAAASASQLNSIQLNSTRYSQLATRNSQLATRNTQSVSDVVKTLFERGGLFTLHGVTCHLTVWTDGRPKRTMERIDERFELKRTSNARSHPNGSSVSLVGRHVVKGVSRSRSPTMDPVHSERSEHNHRHHHHYTPHQRRTPTHKPTTSTHAYGR